ncbi:MAG: hypothetical protein N3E46_06540 [Gemmataceae bacterium]|nr:hypothetical protein [Gemmataceae bacterium]
MYKLIILSVLTILISIKANIYQYYDTYIYSSEKSNFLNIICEPFEIYKNAHYSVVTKMYFDTPRWPERHVPTAHSRCTLNVRYPRYQINEETIGQRYFEGKKINLKEHVEILGDDKKVIIKRTEFSGTDKEQNTTYSSWELRKNLLLSNYACIYGYIPNLYETNSLCEVIYKHIDKIIQNVNMKIKDINILHNDNYGEYKINIILHNNRYLIKSINRISKQHHWYKPNTPIFMMSWKDNPDYPESSLNYETELINYDEFKIVDGKLTFTSIHSKLERYHNNGQRVLEETHYKIENISLNHNIPIKIDIPNDTPISIFRYDKDTDSMKTLEGIEYIWRDGQIVKKVPQGVLEKLTGAHFEGGSLWSRGLVVILIFLVLTLTLAAILYRRRRGNT